MSASRSPDPTNLLLDALPPEAARLLFARMERVPLAVGTTLYETGGPLRHVHFPLDATVSLVSPLQNGSCAEVAVVGREGMAGVCAFMGGTAALSSAVVQRAGAAWRMPARDIAELAREVPALMPQLLRYTQTLFTHMAQTSACHRHHALCPQLCRWLLQHLDRQADDEMRVTQERIAILLGTRREGVTVAALKLQDAGCIRYHRGRIQVLDRDGLEARSCECYEVVRRAYERLGAAAGAGPASSSDAGGLRPRPRAAYCDSSRV